MRIKLKNNIFIDGFVDGDYIDIANNIQYRAEILYCGETDEIPDLLFEELNIDNGDIWNEEKCYCGERDTCYYCQTIFDNSIKQNIIDLINNCKYCLIYKIK